MNNGIDPTRCPGLNKNGRQCKHYKSTVTSDKKCKWHTEDPDWQAERSPHLIEDENNGINVISDPDRWGLKCQFVSKEGNDCKRWAMRGLTVCHSHGGSIQTLKHHGVQIMKDRAERHRIVELAERYNLEGPIDNPLLAMQLLATEIIGFKDYLFEKLTELDDLTNEDRKGVEDAKAIVQLYERALDRTNRILADMSRLKIEERLAMISEKQGEQVAAILEYVLDRLDLGERAPEARNLVVGELKKMQAISA